jgi:kynureninase
MLKGQFELPPGKVYLCGSSLGPMPRAIRQVLCNFQHKWATQAVDGHFDQSAVDSHVVESGWVHCEEQCSRALMPLVGAVDSNEIACLSELSVNLHLLLSAFYPLGAAKRGKQKILMESHCFSSDLLVAQSFLRTRGIVDPGAGGSEGILFFPADDDFCTAPHTAMDFIRQHADDIALMLLSPVNYYTGQLFPIEALTQLCHQFVFRPITQCSMYTMPCGGRTLSSDWTWPTLWAMCRCACTTGAWTLLRGARTST